MSVTHPFSKYSRIAAALVLASFLHVPILWVMAHNTEQAPGVPRKPAVFHLEAQLRPPTAAAKAQVTSPKSKAPAAPTETASQDKSKLPLDPGSPKDPPRRPDFSAGLLSQQISEVSESLVKKRNAESQGKRIVYASEAKGHSATLTAYEEAWQAKVEHIGNLNYPEAARNQGLLGSLTVAVAIRPDGSLYSVQILKSSGNPIIDEGAIKIVRLSAPFAPLPQDLLSDMDILVITRSWRFDDQAHFSSK